jgi:hypothetical protein
MIIDGDCGATGGMKNGRGNHEFVKFLPHYLFVHHESHMT